MVRNEIYLKEYWDMANEACDEMEISEHMRKAREIVFNYQRKLEEAGWILLPMEGGCVSPDRSTIFYSFRAPYEGQLYPWLDDPGEAYQAMVKKMMDSGDFILIE